MAQGVRAVTEPGGVWFPMERIDETLARLEAMVAGDAGQKVPISEAGDELDAIAFGINALGDELRWANARVNDIERRLAADLRISRDNAERANQSKTVFLRTASHEIRTPIAAILSIADLIAGGTLPSEEAAGVVVRLRANCRALLSLVENVLDLSRLDADKLALNRETFSPLDLTREVVDSLESEARKKGLTIQVDFGLLSMFAIDSDRNRLRQILVNLVSNAIKFTMTGGVAIHARPSVDGSRFTIDIADTGVGIAADKFPDLFEPFAQVHPMRAGAQSGAGLGLTLSRRIAEQLGGTLSLLQSEPGTGSTFRLTLGIRPGEGSRVAAGAHFNGAQSDAPPKLLLEGCRVLLAEDYPDLQMAIGRSLRFEGAIISCANDGREAVELAKKATFDVVLMDIKMPVMDGLDATRTLRAAGFRFPIIAFSADSTTDGRAATIAAGCNAYLTKPFEPSDLIASIRFLRNAGERPVGSASLSV